MSGEIKWEKKEKFCPNCLKVLNFDKKTKTYVCDEGCYWEGTLLDREADIKDMSKDKCWHCKNHKRVYQYFKVAVRHKVLSHSPCDFERINKGGY